MRNNKIVPGVTLILIGAAFLLYNYGVINFHWGNMFYLWPIFIVIGGINLIFAHNRSGWATAIKLGVIIAGFGLILFGNFGKHHGSWDGNNFYYDDSDDDDAGNTINRKSIVKVEGNSAFNEAFTADTKIAQLDISGGGTVYTLSDTTNQLFSANTKEFKGRYLFDHSKHDSVSVLNFRMKNNHGFNLNFDGSDEKYGRSNTAVFKLNPNPQWDINLKAGAAKVDFDLAKFKVRSLILSGGAASFNVKLGQPLAITNVKVETGMSQTTISIPTSAACRIVSSTGLSSTNFDGFIKNRDNTYQTPGFGTAKNKMYIKISGGMADFRVERY